MKALGFIVFLAVGCQGAPLATESQSSHHAPVGLPSFEGGLPITAGETGQGAVPYVPPKDLWHRFHILVWQFKTDAVEDLDLYRELGLGGFHIDRGAGQDDRVAFAKKNSLPYYVDHVADKGYLHLTDAHGKQTILKKNHVVPRPNSLADPEIIKKLKAFIQANVATTREGPVLAYALDDEVSIGSFNSPAEVDGSPLSVAGYRRWLKDAYGGIDKLNATWKASFGSFGEVAPVSFEDVRKEHVAPPFSRWNLARWCDWRSYMDTQFADVLGDLVRFTHHMDLTAPVGVVGGQQPAPYGGFDYSKLCRNLQWIEAYDIGGTCEILRSLWLYPERRPYVQTWFSTGEAKNDAWFLWYYLLHGNRGVIAWPAQGEDSWFRYQGNDVAPFIRENVATIREVQGELSRAILDPAVRFDPDPIAVLYSHPSVQVGWVMDVVTHGGSWPNRSSGVDNSCQTAGKNRVAWFKLLEDCGFQYNVVSGGQVAQGALVEQGYRVLILDRAVALSDAETSAIRAFVRAGGTVIADYLTGLFDEHGVGRTTGALDNLFGIQRDESAGYLDGKSITEIDGEFYDKPFIQRLRAYRDASKYQGIVVYERGTRAAKAGQATGRVDGADVIIRHKTGHGRTVYLNLTPVAYYDMNERLSKFGERWRGILTGLLAESGLTPRARVLLGGKPVPLTEVVWWRRHDRLVMGVVKNPARQGTISGTGAIHGVTGEPLDVEIRFRRPVRDVKNLRTGQALPDGDIIRAHWKPWEALLFEMDVPGD